MLIRTRKQDKGGAGQINWQKIFPHDRFSVFCKEVAGQTEIKENTLCCSSLAGLACLRCHRSWAWLLQQHLTWTFSVPALLACHPFTDWPGPAGLWCVSRPHWMTVRLQKLKICSNSSSHHRTLLSGEGGGRREGERREGESFTWVISLGWELVLSPHWAAAWHQTSHCKHQGRGDPPTRQTYSIKLFWPAAEKFVSIISLLSCLWEPGTDWDWLGLGMFQQT